MNKVDSDEARDIAAGFLLTMVLICAAAVAARDPDRAGGITRSITGPLAEAETAFAGRRRR